MFYAQENMNRTRRKINGWLENELYIQEIY